MSPASARPQAAPRFANVVPSLRYSAVVPPRLVTNRSGSPSPSTSPQAQPRLLPVFATPAATPTSVNAGAAPGVRRTRRLYVP